MSTRGINGPVLFLDRDGTLIEEPADFQIDAYEKLRFVRGVIPALLKLRDAGWQFVMVTNQDGLGTDSYPQASFDGPHALMMQVFESQGIVFHDVLIDRSFPHENSPTRKPAIGLALPYIQDRGIDWKRSAMVGDRPTDNQFAANLGIRAFQLKTPQFGGEWDWAGIAHELADAPRRALVQRSTRETRIRVEVDLDRAAARGEFEQPRAGLVGEARPLEPPQQDVGVEEEPHASSPWNARARSSGNSSKSSWMVMRPRHAPGSRRPACAPTLTRRATGRPARAMTIS